MWGEREERGVNVQHRIIKQQYLHIEIALHMLHKFLLLLDRLWRNVMLKVVHSTNSSYVNIHCIQSHVSSLITPYPFFLNKHSSSKNPDQFTHGSACIACGFITRYTMCTDTKDTISHLSLIPPNPYYSCFVQQQRIGVYMYPVGYKREKGGDGSIPVWFCW